MEGARGPDPPTPVGNHKVALGFLSACTTREEIEYVG